MIFMGFYVKVADVILVINSLEYNTISNSLNLSLRTPSTTSVST